MDSVHIGERVIVPRHTPGPWEADPKQRAVVSDSGIVCTIAAWPNPSARYDAHAIAAVPKMLAALSLAYLTLRASHDGNGLVQHGAVADALARVLIEATEGPDAEA